jgi:hypothetical protein
MVAHLVGPSGVTLLGQGGSKDSMHMPPLTRIAPELIWQIEDLTETGEGLDLARANIWPSEVAGEVPLVVVCADFRGARDTGREEAVSRTDRLPR